MMIQGITKDIFRTLVVQSSILPRLQIQYSKTARLVIIHSADPEDVTNTKCVLVFI
jgi:hypothetical protein